MAKRFFFEAVIGIDQTGAVDTKGRPRPLPVAYALRAGPRWIVEASDERGKALRLSSLTPEALEAFLNAIRRRHDLARQPKVAILADCVFGVAEEALPREIGKTVEQQIWELMRRTHSVPGFGRGPAETFFKALNPRSNSRDWPVRRVERICKANSVFQTRPFQKNIQTGTFRLWKEIASTTEPWLSIWPFSQDRGRSRPLTLFEGYPSWYWRQILKAPSRQAVDLLRFLNQRRDVLRVSRATLSVVTRDPNAADAFVLAVAAWALQVNDPEGFLVPGLAAPQEGWILGVKPELD